MHLAVFRGYLDDRAEYFQCFTGIMPKAGSPDQLTARAPTGESTAPCGGFFEIDQPLGAHNGDLSRMCHNIWRFGCGRFQYLIRFTSGLVGIIVSQVDLKVFLVQQKTANLCSDLRAAGWDAHAGGVYLAQGSAHFGRD